MKSKKQKLLPSKRRRVNLLEHQLAAVEAQIARLEKDPHLGLAEQDHFSSGSGHLCLERNALQSCIRPFPTELCSDFVQTLTRTGQPALAY
ncbi:hypothetical protein ACFQY9_06815 [Microvirga aerilata]|uniref:hypothetical protein n=1 Tax=Microvirga aerilata TaxID=670292 RepID=UPI00363A193C